MIIIYASNIHTGGGKVLLEALLKSLKMTAVLFSDARLKLDESLSENIQNLSVKASVFNRLKNEFELRRRARDAKKVLCFGNLPPLFPLATKTDLFFQNTILLKKYSKIPFPWSARLKHAVERAWLRWGLRHIEKVYVQSSVVRDEFMEEFPKAWVVVAPFCENFARKNPAPPPEFDFIYVASGDPHKNHRRLLSAWQLLAEKNIYPSLALTLSVHSWELLGLASSLQKKGLKISNHPDISHEQVMNLYSRSRALIFPSITESFGIPLLEANSLGLPIIAGELDYVRELVTPVQSFDPYSEKSICRAVNRFLMGDSAETHQKVLTPEEFLQLLNS